MIPRTDTLLVTDYLAEQVQAVRPGHGALIGPSSCASGPGSRPCCTANMAAAVRLEAPILA